MFRVMPVCRVVITLVWILISAGVFLVAGRFTAVRFFIGGGIWMQLYLNGLAVSVKDGAVIKLTGNLIKRKTVFVVKSSVRVQTVVVHPGLPAIIRLIFQNRNIYIWGLNGRQVLLIEKYIVSMLKE